MLVVFTSCDDPAPQLQEPRVLSYAHSGVPWIFDADGYQYLIDTGTPRTFVVPPVADRNDDVFVVGQLDNWHVQGIGAHAEVVVTYDLPPAVLPMVGPKFGGILAADLLAVQPFLLDPRWNRFVLDDDGDFTEWLSETDPALRVPVEVLGGGIACMAPARCFSHDGLRMLVNVEVEGQSVVALLDTGSTYTSMGRQLFERLDKGSARTEASISRGWDLWRFVRVARLSIGEASLEDVPVRINPELDTSLARLSVETDRQVEMLLGHSVLLNFMTGLDYAGSTLTLARYIDPGQLETEMFQNFGIWLARSIGEGHERCFPLTALALDSEAEHAGLSIGDCVLALDGLSAADMGRNEGQAMLQRAELGATIRVTVLPASDANERRTVALTKRDLLPVH